MALRHPHAVMALGRNRLPTSALTAGSPLWLGLSKDADRHPQIGHPIGDNCRVNLEAVAVLVVMALYLFGRWLAADKKWPRRVPRIIYGRKK